MWKSFLKQNKKHINLNELYLLVFNELENKDKENKILEHLQNCYDCNSKYVKLKDEINFLLNNSKFLNKETVKVKNNSYFTLKKKLAFYLVSFILIFGIFFLTYFVNFINNHKEDIVLSENIDTLELMKLYDKINLVENNIDEYRLITYDYEEEFNEF
jgi:hypothetical protein